jgi:hypothetical protein
MAGFVYVPHTLNFQIGAMTAVGKHVSATIVAIRGQKWFRSCEGRSMIAIHPEFVVDNDKHPKSVLLPFAEWKQLVEELDELDDIRAYDAAKASAGEKVSLEQAIREIQQGCNS